MTLGDQEIRKILGKCIVKGAEHEMVEIFKSDESNVTATPVVRWCRACGAVVVDEDYDGRISNTGGIREMEFPKITSEIHQHL